MALPVADRSTAKPTSTFGFIFKKAALSALVALALFSLMIGIRTEAGPSGQLIYWTRFGDLAAIVAAVFVGSILIELLRQWLGPAGTRTIVPPRITEGLSVASRFLAPALLVFAIAFVWDGDTALNVMSQLHLGAGPAVLYVALMLLVVPNATLFSSSYLLGPGFTVGAHTLVSPAAVTLGPVPMFPLLAALPDEGPTPFWTPYVLALAPIVAVVAVVLVQRRQPTLRWEHGAVRGLAAGIVAAVVVTILSGLAGGAVGPGRMADVGPLAIDTLWHAVTSFGVGGLLAGTVMTWWQRRHAAADPAADSLTQ